MVTPNYSLKEKAIVGGIEGVCYYLVKSLKKMENVEIEVILPNAQLYGLQKTEKIIVDGTKISALVAEGKNPFYYKLFVQMPKLLKEKLTTIDCDIIHFQGVASWVKYTKKPYILTVHGIGEKDSLFRGNPFMAQIRSLCNMITEGYERKKAENIIAITPYVRSFLNKKQRVWDIPNPVPDEYFNVKRIPQFGRILSIANISKRKNQIGLIKAFARLSNRFLKAELILAGLIVDKSYGKKCRDLIYELNITDKVHFLGGVGIQKIIEELSKAHCMILPSFQETAPLSISEAMAAGVPVISSNNCGIPWMIENGKTGRLVDPYNDTNIAAVLEKIILEDDFDKMGNNAKRFAEKNYKASMVAERTLEAYKKILKTE